MADGRKNHGGRRPGQGRKKGSGISNLISKVVKEKVDEILIELLKNEEFKTKSLKSIKDYSVFCGWIYIIKDKKSNLYKVGMTQRDTINQRMTLYHTNFIDIDIIYYDKVDYVIDLENELHSIIDIFEKGDWFKCNIETLCRLIYTISNHKHNGRTQKCTL
jgi:hypothetical protein